MTEGDELAQLLKKQGWLTPSERQKCSKAFEAYAEYSQVFISFVKLRAGCPPLTPEEQSLSDLIAEARALFKAET